MVQECFKSFYHPFGARLGVSLLEDDPFFPSRSWLHFVMPGFSTSSYYNDFKVYKLFVGPKVGVCRLGWSIIIHGLRFLGRPAGQPRAETGRRRPPDPIRPHHRASTAAGPCSGDTHFFDGKQLYDFDFARPRSGGEPSGRERTLASLIPWSARSSIGKSPGSKKPPEERSQGLKGAIKLPVRPTGGGRAMAAVILQAETKWGTWGRDRPAAD